VTAPSATTALAGARGGVPPHPAGHLALPSITTGRLLLLVAAVTASSLFVYDFLYLAVASQSQGPRGAVVWMAAGVALLLSVAALIVLVMPAWIVRRRRLTPLLREDAQELDDELRRLAAEAGLARPPAPVVDALDPSVSALVFGLPGRRRLWLNGGLVTLWTTDPAAFRATVRHELAHLRNRDVDETYVAMAVWNAFVLTALAPLAAALLWERGDHVLGMAWRAVVLAVVVVLFRNGVLRAREYAADARAAVWDGPDGALKLLLTPSPASVGLPIWRRLRVSLGTHPPMARRRRALDNATPLNRLGFWDALGAGLVATVAFNNVTLFINSVIAQPQPLTVRWIAALPFAPAAATGLTLGVWRATLWRRGRARDALVVGTGLASGVLLGAPLSLSSAITGVAAGPVTLQGAAAAALVLLAVLVLLVAWIRAGALAWLPATRDGWRGVASVGAVLATAVVLTVVLGYWMLLSDLHPLLPSLTAQARSEYGALGTVAAAGPAWLWLLVQHPLVLHVVAQDPVLLGVVLLWLVPVAGLLLQRAHRSTAVGVVLTALAAGAVFGSLVLLHRHLLHASSQGGQVSDAFLLIVHHWHLVGAITTQALVAGAVAWRMTRRSRPLPVILALLAGFVSGVVTVIAILGGTVVGGCVEAFSLRPGPCAWTLQRDYVDMVTRWVLVEGAFAAVFAGLLGAGAAAGVGAGRGRKRS
jgi:Zn-dependent protease with chaperone function